MSRLFHKFHNPDLRWQVEHKIFIPSRKPTQMSDRGRSFTNEQIIKNKIIGEYIKVAQFQELKTGGQNGLDQRAK